jgi:hypothetical protein
MLDVNRSSFLSPDSLYVSLEELSLREELIDEWSSEKQDRYIYFIVQQQEHHSLVRIHIRPFQLTKYPEQWFYSVTAHCTPCCRDAKVNESQDRLCTTAQRVYGLSFQLQKWNFSSPHCWCVLHKMDNG